MSSTDNEKRLRAFFREQIIPVATRCNAAAMLPLRSDPSIASYYRHRDEASRYIFELEPAQAAAYLAELWKDEPELHNLIAPLLSLAESLTEQSESSAEISPFVYAMF